jgi:GNAT superfamily N-acetyltransferase
MDIRIIDKNTGEDSQFSNQDIAQFLYEHLDEFGDTKNAISKAIDYAFEKDGKPGGFVVIGVEKDELVGAVVMNKTGMEEYIPEYILVYIAVDRKMRGKGAGRQLMSAAAEKADGDIALHVEPNNPARHLYEKLGYTNKYLEMRLKNK